MTSQDIHELSFLLLKMMHIKLLRNWLRFLQNENDNSIKQIQSDHGGEFQNAKFDRFCEKTWDNT